MSFKFLDEKEPDPSLSSDLQALNAFNDEQLDQFVEMVFGLLRESIREPDAAIKEFAAEHSINTRPLTKALKGVLLFFSESLKRNLPGSTITSDLLLFGISEDKASHIGDTWQSNYVALSSALMAKTLTVNQLRDMEWKFGVTTSSDELSNVGKTFLQLKLAIDRGNDRVENVIMELSLSQFYKFLEEMEKAKMECQTS